MNENDIVLQIRNYQLINGVKLIEWLLLLLYEAYLHCNKNN